MVGCAWGGTASVFLKNHLEYSGFLDIIIRMKNTVCVCRALHHARAGDGL